MLPYNTRECQGIPFLTVEIIPSFPKKTTKTDFSKNNLDKTLEHFLSYKKYTDNIVKITVQLPVPYFYPSLEGYYVHTINF